MINHTGLAEKYEIISVLGQGGFGTTYLVSCKNTREKFAIKHISLEKNDYQDYNEIIKLKEIIEREISIQSKIFHPQIPKLYEFIKSETERTIEYFFIQQF